VAVEVRAEPGHHQRGWCRDRGGPAEHGGGGEVGVPDLAEEAKWIWRIRRMVLGGEGWS
jgi:hypothetical protein